MWQFNKGIIIPADMSCHVNLMRCGVKAIVESQYEVLTKCAKQRNDVKKLLENEMTWPEF